MKQLELVGKKMETEYFFPQKVCFDRSLLEKNVEEMYSGSFFLPWNFTHSYLLNV